MSSVNRREFIRSMVKLSTGALSLPLLSKCSSENKLKILILGGTNFVGPALVRSLINSGHEVVLFNRGITNPYLFPELRKIRGDRELGEEGYKNLIGEETKWDAIIDVWPQNPSLVEDAVNLMRQKTNHYLFISSIAVYQDFKNAGIKEEYTTRDGDEYKKGNYGLNKVLCEDKIEEVFSDRFTIFRCGGIVGERDEGPFTNYYVNKMVNYSDMLAPDANDPIQFIDVNDLANFVSRCIENEIFGSYNVIGPLIQMGYKDMLLDIKKSLNSSVNIHWMSPDFIIRQAKLSPFVDIPFWIPIASDPEPGFYQIDNTKSVGQGLKFSPIRTTTQSAYKTLTSISIDQSLPINRGVELKRELEIITAWKEGK